MKKIYLASDSFRDLEEVMARMPGIKETQVGYANPSEDEAADELVAAGSTDAAECVCVSYNPNFVDITSILSLYFKIVNPYVVPDSPKHRTGVYYESWEDAIQIEYYFRFLTTRGMEPVTTDSNIVMNDSVTRGIERRPLLTELGKIKRFVPAPEEEQRYLQKNAEASSKYDLEALKADGLIR